MPQILGVTNPVPGYESTNNRSLPVSPNDTSIQNIPDPTRVGRADARTDRQDSNSTAESSVPRYGSNLQAFLQRLRSTPDLTQSMSQLFFAGHGTLVSSGLNEGIAAELAQFIEMLQMDQSQLLHFLTNQFSASTRFGGPLFSLLREAFANTQMESMRESILLFAKKFSDYSSTRHIEGNLLRNLRRMAQSMPARWANRLIELTGMLENGIASGDRAGNLKLLQGQIVPYMGEYTERTHDIGTTRNLLTLLSLDISRYENGSEEGLLQSFRSLTGYGGLRDTLGKFDEQTLRQLLRDTALSKPLQEDPFTDHLTAAAARALRGEGGADLQNAFREIVGAFLINESVYMPLNHLIIPLEWNGQMMFSELWVDPDAEEKGADKQERRSSGRTLRFLFKMDIQSLGFFDMVLSCRGEQVDLRVFCPERIAPFSKLIQGELTRILTENGLQPSSVQVARMEKPLSISAVFPTLFHGKESVDVKV